MSRKPKRINSHARFGLSKPGDLLDKLWIDIERMRVAEAESRGKEVIYSAMDCAVTIIAIKDWTKHYRESRGLPQINFHDRIPRFAMASEIANGMKHYIVENEYAKDTGFFSGSVFIKSSGGKPVIVPHFVTIGWDGETLNPRMVFEDIAKAIKILIEQDN